MCDVKNNGCRREGPNAAWAEPARAFFQPGSPGDRNGAHERRNSEFHGVSISCFGTETFSRCVNLT